MSLDKDYSQDMGYQNEVALGFWDQIASYISAIFSPPLTVVYGILLSIPFLNVSYPSLWSILFLSLFVFPPTAYVYLLLRQGDITDFHINVRSQRLKPLFLILVNTIFALVAYHHLGGPTYLIVLAACCLITVVFMLLFTFFWKISGHCAAVGGLSVVMLSLLGESAIPFTVLVPIVAWSRVKMGRHSIAQAIFGVLLGILTFGCILYFLNLL